MGDLQYWLVNAYRAKKKLHANIVSWSHTGDVGGYGLEWVTNLKVERKPGKSHSNPAPSIHITVLSIGKVISFCDYALPIYNVMFKVLSHSKIPDFNAKVPWFLGFFDGSLFGVYIFSLITALVRNDNWVAIFPGIGHWLVYIRQVVRQSSLIAGLASRFITSPGLYTQIHLQLESPNNWRWKGNVLTYIQRQITTF